MKKAITIALAISALLVGCGNSQDVTTRTTAESTTTAPTETLPETSRPETGIYDDTIILGNIKFTIPDGFYAMLVNENTVSLTPSDADCSIGLAALDISQLDEDKTKLFLPQMYDSFMLDGADRINESTMDGYAAGRDVTFQFYGEIDGTTNTINMDAAFTDSWYAYMIILKCDPESEALEDNTKTFIEMVGHSEYIGEDPRFDFVQ